MNKKYVDIPIYTTLTEMIEKEYSFSATQYKTFSINNKNVLTVGEFLSRDLTKNDLGKEVGSERYVDNSDYIFIKTKALQEDCYLLDINKESIESIIPNSLNDMNLKQGDIIISKDSNVGEIAILDKDYPKAMLCGGIYRLPIIKNKYYLLAFIKSEVFRQQIDFIVPKGSTIRHGKTKFLECKVPIPNKNKDSTIKYVEVLTKAIINKEILIREKHKLILTKIEQELNSNQKDKKFKFSMPTINEMIELGRMDSNRYCKEYKEFKFLITNYKNGYTNIPDLGYNVKRGQNLQVDCIGKSHYVDEPLSGYYNLILSKNMTSYGTLNKYKYLGNINQLQKLKQGDIIFSARGAMLGRSLVMIEDVKNTITNIDSMVFDNAPSLQKSIFVHLLLDLYRKNDFIKKIGIYGSGAESVTKYQVSDILIPNFSDEKEKEIVKYYHNEDSKYDTSEVTLENFLEYDNKFNKEAGIYELDKSMKQIKEKLKKVIDDITNDIEVNVDFII